LTEDEDSIDLNPLNPSWLWPYIARQKDTDQ